MKLNAIFFALCSRYPHTQFLRLHANNLQTKTPLDPIVLPTLMIYQCGELVKNYSTFHIHLKEGRVSEVVTRGDEDADRVTSIHIQNSHSSLSSYLNFTEEDVEEFLQPYLAPYASSSGSLQEGKGRGREESEFVNSASSSSSSSSRRGQVWRSRVDDDDDDDDDLY